MKHFFSFCTLRSAAVALFIGSTATAQTTIAGFEVNGLTGYGPSPLAATTSASNVTVGGLTRGSGLTTAPTAASNAFGANGWNPASVTAADAVLANDFFLFTVTVVSGTVDFGQFQFNYRRSGGGPTAGQLQYSTDGVTFNDVATGVFAYTSTATGGVPVSASLTGITDLQGVIAGTTITFRLVNFSAANTTGTFYVANSTTVPGEDLIVSTSPPLSVDLLSFAGRANGALSQFSWTTSCTSDAWAFSVERSAEGNTFTEIGRVEASSSECGNSTRTYRFETPARSGLYRLAMQEASGETSFSNVVSIQGGEAATNTTLSIFPTPVSNVLQIRDAAAGTPLRVVDLTGRTLLSRTANGTSDEIAVDDLPTGMYLLQAGGDNPTVYRFQKN